MNKGLFITIEGGEGSGKSTLQKQLADYFSKKGRDVIQTREPGGTELGENIRKLLLSNHHSYKIGSQAELLLFLAARAQHIEEVIKPALEAGKVVICDRFNDSTIAYQGMARGIDLKKVRKLCEMVCGETNPNLTLFLDVDPTEGLLRTKKLSKEHALSGQFDRIESETLDFHQKVRKAFLKIVKREPLRIYRIDANMSQQTVYQAAVRTIEELLIKKE